MRRFVTYGGRRARGKAGVAILAGLFALPLQAETTILALGDSLTQGYGLPQDDGFVPQLQGWLRDHGHEVTVINGGVSGDTSRGGASRVDWSLTDDVDAMIVTLGGNDVLRGLDPAETRKNLDGILAAGQAKGVEMLVIGMRAAGNYGTDYKTAFDANYPELAEAYGTLYAPSFFDGLLEGGEDPSAAMGFMQADGIHPNAEGVAKIVAQLGPKVEELIARVEDNSDS